MEGEGVSPPLQKRSGEETGGDCTPTKLVKLDEDKPEESTNGHSVSPVKPRVDEHDKLPPELKMMFEPNNCKLCNIPLSSNIVAYTHYRGKLHSKKVKQYLIEHHLPMPDEPVTPKKHLVTAYASKDGSQPSDQDLPPELKAMFLPLECKLCNVVSSSPIPAHHHYIGKSHRRKVKEYLLSQTPSTPAPQLTDDSDNNLISCALCNVAFTSAIHANQHYIGKKHKQKLKSGPDNRIPVPKAEEDTSGRFGIGEAFLV